MGDPLVGERGVTAHSGATDVREATVVVPTRNAGAALQRLVEALAVQTVPRDRFEVVVADDGSDDGSTFDLDRSDGWLRLSPGPPQNSYVARNRAAALARGGELAFCDSDCVPERDWLERGLCALERSDLVAGRVLFELPPRTSVWSLLDVDMFLDQERAVASNTAATANLFVRRSLFEAMQGFDDSLPNQGDHDFVGRCVAAGSTLAFASDVIVRHPPRGGARELLGKVWRVNYMHALRACRTGRRPTRLRVRSWVPFVQTARVRRSNHRSFGLDRRRLAEHGIRPTLLDNMRAVPVIYIVVPYIANAAQLAGFLAARQR
jgi:glycosyltransferase involved in cell wall biosynthesis